MTTINSIGSLVKESNKSISIKQQESLEAEKKRLMKSAKEMESLFLNQLLKTMRATIPKSDDESAGLGGDMGKDIYTQMFDQEIATKMAGINDRSIASMIYRSMEKNLAIRHGVENKETLVKDILPTQNYLKINNVLSNAQVKSSTRKMDGRGDRLSSRYDNIISKVAEKYKVNPNLVKAIIKTESNFDKNAISPAGAKGLMQLVDSTAADMKVNNVFNPAQNIEGGTKYLRTMINKFGDIKEALAAYNAGPGTVMRYGGIPPFKETQEYVDKVLSVIGDEPLDYQE
ncbi:MAG: transglycosylase SLT domain-containing protein [Candidatus Zixiibacteriota bacterium]